MKILIHPMKSFIVTSWIHNIASIGKSEQVVTWFLNLIFQHENDGGVGNFSNCSSDICFLCCPTIEFCGMSTSIDELMFDGLVANVGIGIVPLFCSSSLAKEVLVPVACGTDPVSLLVSYNGEFLDDDFGTDQKYKIDYQKRFLVIQMYQMANVCRGSSWNGNLESLVTDWERKTNFH